MAYNASGLVVKYQKTGDGIVTKTLTAADWAEGIDGSYNIRFTAEELDTIGLFSYWIEYTPSTTYPGATTVVSEPNLINYVLGSLQQEFASVIAAAKAQWETEQAASNTALQNAVALYRSIVAQGHSPESAFWQSELHKVIMVE